MSGKELVRDPSAECWADLDIDANPDQIHAFEICCSSIFPHCSYELCTYS